MSIFAKLRQCPSDAARYYRIEQEGVITGEIWAQRTARFVLLLNSKWQFTMVPIHLGRAVSNMERKKIIMIMADCNSKRAENPYVYAIYKLTGLLLLPPNHGLWGSKTTRRNHDHDRRWWHFFVRFCRSQSSNGEEKTNVSFSLRMLP